MNTTDEIEFLVLIRDKIDILTGEISLNEKLIEISAMLGGRIEKLQKVEAIVG